MKTMIHLSLLALFSIQNTLAFPAQHQLQAQALDAATQLDAAAEAFENTPTESLPQTETADKKWVQKLSRQLQTKGLKRYEKRLEKELAQSALSEAEKAQVRTESLAQSQTAIAHVIQTAKQSRNPLQLVKTLKQNLREARTELARARAEEAANQGAKNTKQVQTADRKPAQIVISINIRNLLKAIAIIMVAIMLVMLVYGLVALVTTVFLPVLVVAVVITIVI